MSMLAITLVVVFLMSEGVPTGRDLPGESETAQLLWLRSPDLERLSDFENDQDVLELLDVTVFRRFSRIEVLRYPRLRRVFEGSTQTVQEGFEAGRLSIPDLHRLGATGAEVGRRAILSGVVSDPRQVVQIAAWLPCEEIRTIQDRLGTIRYIETREDYKIEISLADVARARCMELEDPVVFEELILELAERCPRWGSSVTPLISAMQIAHARGWVEEEAISVLTPAWFALDAQERSDEEGLWNQVLESLQVAMISYVDAEVGSEQVTVISLFPREVSVELLCPDGTGASATLALGEKPALMLIQESCSQIKIRDVESGVLVGVANVRGGKSIRVLLK